MRGDSGVAGEGRVVGIPTFYSWGKYTIPLTDINSDWMSNGFSGLCIIPSEARLYPRSIDIFRRRRRQPEVGLKTSISQE